MRRIIAFLSALCLFPAFGTERTVDFVDLAQGDASLTLGNEFPGAKGGLTVAEADGVPVLRLSADLERGAYVGMNFREPVPEGSSRIRFSYRVASSAETCCVIFRFRDREGQYHLQRRNVAERGTWVESEFDLFAPASHWGAKVDDGVVRLPTEECTFAFELRGRSGRSGTLDLRGARLVTTAGYDRLAPFVLKASSPRFGALYRPDETVEIGCRVFRRDGDVAADGLMLRVEDWRGQELFRRTISAGSGRERISADELCGRFGAFRAELSLPGQPAVKPGETWFARLTAKDDPKPCRWVGVGIHASHGWGGGDFRFLDLFTAAGIGLCRDEVSWRAVELQKGVYAMPENFERLVDGLHRRGIRFNNLLNSKNSIYDNPLDPDAFARYCAWHVRHLGDRCDLYEIWNEPHNFNFYQVYRDVYGYGRKPDGSMKDERGNVNLPWIPRFVELSRKAVGAIRAANPKADVAVCAEDSFPLLKKMLELGIATSNEVVTIHNYDHRNYPPEGDWFNRTDGRELREFASAHGGATRFATTEDGWTTYRGGPNGEYAFVGNYPPCTPEQQARYLVRMYVTGRQNGLEYISQYDFRDDGPRRNYTEHNFGIVHEDFTPKPSFAAIAYMTRRIGASQPAGDIGGDHAKCRIYRFRDPDGRRTYVCWAIAGEVKVPLPSEMSDVGEMADLQGNVRPFSPTSEIALDENPVYLRR